MLPDSIPEWVGFGATALTVIGMVVGFIWRTSSIVTTMQAGFKAHGERLGALEQTTAMNSSSLRELQGKDQGHEFKLMSLSEGHGELRGRIDQLISVMERQGHQKNEREIEIAGRLARIEERLDLFPKMLELFKGRNP